MYDTFSMTMAFLNLTLLLLSLLNVHFNIHLLSNWCNTQNVVHIHTDRQQLFNFELLVSPLCPPSSIIIGSVALASLDMFVSLGEIPGTIIIFVN